MHGTLSAKLFKYVREDSSPGVTRITLYLKRRNNLQVQQSASVTYEKKTVAQGSLALVPSEKRVITKFRETQLNRG